MNRLDIIHCVTSRMDGQRVNARVGDLSYVGAVAIATDEGFRLIDVEVHCWKGLYTGKMESKFLTYDEIKFIHPCVKYVEKPKSPHEAVMVRGLIKGKFRCSETGDGLQVEVIEPHYDSDVVIRMGSEEGNEKLYIDKEAAGVLVAFFKDVEKSFEN